MKHPRILFIQTDTGLSGGVATYIGELVRSEALSEFGCVVAVSTDSVGSPELKKMYGAAEIIGMPPTYSLSGFLAYVLRLIRSIRESKIELIHAHAIRSAFAASFASLVTGVPLVYTNHGLRYRQKRNPLNKAIFWFMELMACRVARITIPIRRYDETLLKCSKLALSKRVCLIETRIPDILSANQGDSSSNLLLGVGSLIAIKRPDRFINWVAALKRGGVHADACWIGEGPLRSAMEGLASSSSVALKLTGHLSRREVFDYLAKASLLLLTSELETFPLAVLEAYAHGVPVVSARFEGVNDFILDGKTGLVVDADNLDDVAGAIKLLLSDVDRLNRMRRNARAFFLSRFCSVERMACDYRASYLACL